LRVRQFSLTVLTTEPGAPPGTSASISSVHLDVGSDQSGKVCDDFIRDDAGVPPDPDRVELDEPVEPLRLRLNWVGADMGMVQACVGQDVAPQVEKRNLSIGLRTGCLWLHKQPGIVLGDSSIRTTMDTYSHVLENMKEDAAQKVSVVLFGA